MKAPHQQPQVSAKLRLIAAAHVHNGIALDLYGTIDEDGYEVNDVCLTGTAISLYDIVSLDLLSTLTDWCQDHLPKPKLPRHQRQSWLYGQPALLAA